MNNQTQQIPTSNIHIPMVVDKGSHGERAYDIFSLLLEKRIIFLGSEINDVSANIIVAQLLYLDNVDPKTDISLYINSPGGSVSAGLAIYDTMQFIKADVSTICVGMAASMGQLLLCGGAEGKRFSLPNSAIMMHQPLGGTQGQASDIEIYTQNMMSIRDRLYKIISTHTGKSEKTIKKDADRDNYMTADEALKYGMIDNIITTKI